VIKLVEVGLGSPLAVQVFIVPSLLFLAAKAGFCLSFSSSLIALAIKVNQLSFFLSFEVIDLHY